jgi:hypothetical protein
MKTPCYTIIPSIVHETIDGEVVIANLSNGNYYNLQNTATSIWEMIKNGATLEQIVFQLSQKYDGNQEEITTSTQNFINELVKEELISCDNKNQKPQINATPATPTEDRVAFQAPQLEKFTDMQSLLMIDPIHEINVSTGWPNKPEEK